IRRLRAVRLGHPVRDGAAGTSAELGRSARRRVGFGAYRPIRYRQFSGVAQGVAEVDISEEPNTPEMWEHQFPFADLMNGDMLTIDVSAPEEPHPVRYFSHDLEGLHGRAIAPDFLTFVTEYAKLGCAGGTHDDWFDFVEKRDNDRHYL